MFRYVCVEEFLFNREHGHYRSFGIRAFHDYCEVAFLSDISTDVSFVDFMAALCTRLQLDPIHLMDVMEDMIGLFPFPDHHPILF